VLLTCALGYAAYHRYVSDTFAAVIVLVLALTVRFAAETTPITTSAEETNVPAEEKEPKKTGKGSKKKK
jgi:hypothetical protein